MTVLEKQAAAGVNPSRIGQALLAALLTAAIAVGVIMAVNPRAVTAPTDNQSGSQFLIDTDSPTHQGRTGEMVIAPESPGNGAVGGTESAAPILTGTETPTHTGRTSP